MQAVTLSIAVAASLLVLVLRPAKAFAIYITVLLWYPTYLVVRFGPLDISAVRIVVFVLLMRCLLDPSIRKDFKWSRLDSWVTCGIIVGVVVPVIASSIPAMRTLENRLGRLPDTYFAYLAARFCLTGHRATMTAIKGVAVAVVPLAVVGMVESYTGWQSFNVLKAYCPWHHAVEPELNPRSGFYRAVGPFNHSIAYGVSLATLVPLIYCLRYEKDRWGKFWYLFLTVVVLGVLSSMSSGPLTMLGAVILCLALERFKYLTKPLLIAFAFSCVVVQIASNRSFYRVFVSYVNPLGGAGWHRAKIIDLAIEHFDEWWLLGYGGRDPGWGASLGMTWTDITNHYVVTGVENGLLGIIAICGMLATALYMIIRLYRSEHDHARRSCYWAFGSSVVAMAIAFNAVLFSGQAGTLFYCTLGFVASSHNIAFGTRKCSVHRRIQSRSAMAWV